MMQRPLQPLLRQLFIFVTLLSFALPAWAQDAAPPPETGDHPMVTWKKMGLGTTPPGGIVERQAFVVNSTPNPVLFTGITPGSDAISIIDFAPVVVPPHYAQPFDFIVRMPRVDGIVNEKLTLHFEDMEPLTLPLLGQVRANGKARPLKIGVLGAVPDPAIAPAVAPGEWSDGHIWVFNRSSGPVTIKSVRSSCACLKPISPTRFTLAPFQATQYKFQIEAPDQFKRPSRQTLTFVMTPEKSMRVLVEVNAIPPAPATTAPATGPTTAPVTGSAGSTERQ